MGNGAVLYHEPSILTILIQSSFILALNVVDFILNRAISCGLIGQIIVGMAYGTPGADILGLDFQQAVADLGYLGLILLVFEGGLSTYINALRQNLVLSSLVAFTGIMLPIGLSFVLIQMCSATTLQAFAAGCALSSTSLGTTFTVLKTSGLGNSRLGVVLTSAAMLDDVVGLVLVQVISNLGSSSGAGFTASTVVRPVFVSIAYAILVPALLFLTKEVVTRVVPRSLKHSKVRVLSTSRRGRFLVQAALLAGALASAAYAGTSVLFAAYLAGLLISSASTLSAQSEHLVKPAGIAEAEDSAASASQSVVAQDGSEIWEVVPRHGDASEASKSESAAQDESQQPVSTVSGEQQWKTSGVDAWCQTSATDLERSPGVYETYYANIVDTILKPFFFVSCYPCIS